MHGTHGFARHVLSRGRHWLGHSRRAPAASNAAGDYPPVTCAGERPIVGAVREARAGPGAHRARQSRGSAGATVGRQRRQAGEAFARNSVAAPAACASAPWRAWRERCCRRQFAVSSIALLVDALNCSSRSGAVSSTRPWSLTSGPPRGLEARRIIPYRQRVGAGATCSRRWRPCAAPKRSTPFLSCGPPRTRSRPRTRAPGVVVGELVDYASEHTGAKKTRLRSPADEPSVRRVPRRAQPARAGRAKVYRRLVNQRPFRTGASKLISALG